MYNEILVEHITVIHTSSGTSYRVRPNPDGGDGYTSGAALEWSDDGNDWKGYFFVAPEVLEALGNALLAAAESMDDK